MIRLYLQMFGGRGGSSGAGAGGGGTNASGKAPAPASNNAPGHHGSAGGRKMDTAGTNHIPKQVDILNDVRYNVDRIRDGKARFFEDNLSGKEVKGILGSGYKYDSSKDEYIDKYGRRYKVYKTRKK